MKDLIIRKGAQSDIPEVLSLIRELAEYERALDSVEVTEEQLVADGFGSSPLYEFLIATQDGQIIGMSLYYYRYSTWKGKGLYLEDLIVREAFRGDGVGKKLLLETARLAREQQCTGMYWQVLDWNTPAIDFYRSLGSEFDREWINCKLDRNGLEKIV